jgi:hypothetical protein
MMNEERISKRGGGTSEVAYTAGTTEIKESKIPLAMDKGMRYPLEDLCSEVVPIQMETKTNAINAVILCGELTRLTQNSR